MNELSTKVKDKLNILQKFKLGLFKRNIFRKSPEEVFEKYKNSPSYIKSDSIVVLRLLSVQKDFTEEELCEIPEEILLEQIKSGMIEMSKFSEEKQVEFLSKIPEMLYSYDREKRIRIICEEVIKGNYSFIEITKNERGDVTDRDLLEYLKSNNKLDEVLPQIIQYLDIHTIGEVLKHKPQLVQNIEEEKQFLIFSRNPEILKYANIEIQLKYIIQNPKAIEFLSSEAVDRFVEADRKNLLKLTIKQQIEMVARHPEIYKDVSYEAQKNIYGELKTPEAIQAVISLLKHDIKNAKFLKFLEKEEGKYDIEKLYALFQGVEELEDESFKEMFLHSKIMSAIGKLSSARYVFHGITGGEEMPGLDGYNDHQIRIIQSLPVEKIAQLIEIDNNYVLPYLAGRDLYNHGEVFRLTQDEKKQSQDRCEALFLHMFGEEKLKEFQECISVIYQMQTDKIKLENNLYYSGSGRITDKTEFKQRGEIPLEEFKLLFNEHVLANNTPDQIQEYLQEKSKGNDDGELFRQIIERSYGEKAKIILEARQNLNVHSINSIEIFDERILDGFGESFVHDCISYNLRDFSEFLEVIKNPDRAENFKIYYEILIAIYGKNVETMQKAISEYYYVEELLIKAKDVELTDKQYENLVSVICSIRNPLNIHTLKELQNYDEIANASLREQIDAYIKNGGTDVGAVRAMVAENLFGMRYQDDRTATTYGFSVEYMNQMYSLQDEEKENGIYAEDERKMLQVLDFLHKELNMSKVIQFANNLMEERGIRNPRALQSAMRKTRENQNEILNKSLSSVEKLNQLCEDKDGLNGVRKEEIDGVTVYHLEGAPFTFLAHDIGDATDRNETMEYEGQAGNTAICCRMVNQEVGNFNNQFLYMSVDDDMLIASSERDANTQHISKRVKNTGYITVKAKNIPQMTSTGNEVAFYRRYRNHEKVNNQNHGGRRVPDAYGLSNIAYLSENIKLFCKKYKIPVIIKHYEYYKEKSENIHTLGEGMEEKC